MILYVIICGYRCREFTDGIDVTLEQCRGQNVHDIRDYVCC